jgi:N-acetylmuramoyl-L-alanine amidase
MRNMRKSTDYIVIHCAATPPGMDIGIETVREWHKARGFRDVGYHYFIKRDGTRQTGRSINEIGAHVIGHNYHSVGLCMAGGVADGSLTPQDNFTEKQWTALYLTLKELHEEFPKAVIVGHKDLDASKACPSFEVSKWVADKPEFAPEV